jgi:hypothetical protein
MLDQTIRKKSRLLLDRLERISADSPWAHQASGVRASLAKLLEGEDPNPEEIEVLQKLGYQILEKAASEIPDREKY